MRKQLERQIIIQTVHKEEEEEKNIVSWKNGKHSILEEFCPFWAKWEDHLAKWRK